MDARSRVRATSTRMAVVLGLAATFSLVGPALAQVSTCESTTFSPFDPNDPRLSYNNAAAVDTNDGTLDLTPPLNSQSGSVFTVDDLNLGDDAAFSSAFSFSITEAGGGGADGIVFTLQTVSSSTGGGGGGIGYAGLDPSVGIEFDTWFNGGSDPDENHVGINVDGDMLSIATATPPGQLDGGEVFFAWVDYDGTTDLLEVRVATTDTRPDDALLSSTLDLADILLETPDTEVFVGFTSGTGAANARHTILTWEFVNCLANIGAPPTASDDAYETDEDTPLPVAAPGILSNDVGVGLSVDSAATDTVTGTLTVNADGSLDYEPPASAQTMDDGDTLEESFTYDALNVDGSDTATVTITVLGLNDPPTADAGAEKLAMQVGDSATLAGATTDIDEGDEPTVLWTIDGPCTFSDPTSLTPTVTCTEPGTWIATITADDGDATASDQLEIEVLAAPEPPAPEEPEPTMPETGFASGTLGLTALLLLGAGWQLVRLGRRRVDLLAR